MIFKFKIISGQGFSKFIFSTYILLLFSCSDKQDSNLPKVLDDRITLEVILEAPDIVTPIGLTIDDEDNVYVLESHTHTPMKDYDGRKYDRILKGVDEDGDSKPDRWMVYVDNIHDGMNIDWYEGSIYLIEKDSVFALRDTDNDGISDQKDLLVQMRTVQDVYDHAGLLGVTVSEDGWVYVSKGNCAGMELQIIGTDGSLIDSYGDGGSIFRCRTDGSKVEEIATGFWNPFDIKFTSEGRLMVADNDPDSRGPNRLLEIVPGGDYGYQSLYGGSGLHPFLAWNGELPGTLPYAAGIGEAPSGLLDASYSNFPAEYKGNILVTIWEENSIVRIPLEPYLQSVKGSPEVLVQGDSLFHPVAIQANSKGDVYLTDWVIRQYPNHGYGRILMLSSGEDYPVSGDLKKGNPFFAMWDSPPGVDRLLEVVKAGDPYMQTVARALLARGNHEEEIYDLIADANPDIRMQGLLSLKKSNLEPDKKTLTDLLHDEQPEIRKMTLIYLATHFRTDMYPTVLQSLSAGHITSEIFEIYLETIKYLQPDFIENFRSRTESVAKQIKTELPENYIFSVIKDETLSDDIRSIALPYLEDVDSHIPYLMGQLADAGPALQQALLLALKGSNNNELAEELAGLATNTNLAPEVRAQAMVNLEYQGSGFCEEIKKVLAEDDPVLVETATRYLCRCRGEEDIAELMRTSKVKSAYRIWQQCKGTLEEDRPTDHEQWLSALNGGGSVDNGWMIFQTPKAMCMSCHQVNKWGGIFGPALTHIGSSKSLEQLAYAILQPDKEIAPEWQGWYIKDKEGVTHLGRQIDVGGGRSAKLMLADGEFENFHDIQDFGVTPHSLMPDGLENQLTVGEMNDLITFLKSLK